MISLRRVKAIGPNPTEADNNLLKHDAKWLLKWRNDSQTRMQSTTDRPISWDEHVDWLGDYLDKNKGIIFIAELRAERQIGTVRIDNDGQMHWTVAPEYRGQGYGKLIVKMAADEIEGRKFARIKPGNIASIKIAKAADIDHYLIGAEAA